MSDLSTIEWTDATWNPVTGCTKVSPGCAHCYIERTPPFRMAGRRFETADGESTTGVTLHEDRLNAPIRWRKPRRVFVCSLADLFHDNVPDYYLDVVFGVMAATRIRGIDGQPGHTFQVLTKRPDRALEYLAAPGRIERIARAGAARFEDGDNAFDLILDQWPIPNVWVGVSIESARYTWRADVLREIPAAVRFISAEPLLGSLYPSDDREVPEADTLTASTVRDTDTREPRRGAGLTARAPLTLTGIDWVIVGGESGPGARPFHLQHGREIIRVASTMVDRPAIFIKQLGTRPVGGVLCKPVVGITGKGGDMSEWPADLRIREFPLTAVPA